MNTEARVFGIAVAAGSLLVLQPASAAIITGVPQSKFGGATVEMFSVDHGAVNSFDFGNGMVYANLVGQADLVGYTGGYGMGNGPFVDGGIDGPGTGYFGTSETPTTFELVFAAGISHFGFYGAESHVDNGSLGRNAELDMEFYDTNNVLIDVIAESTPFDTHAWDQFHGFRSDGKLIGRIIFRDVGHMVMDNVQWVPTPGALALDIKPGSCPNSFNRNSHGVLPVALTGSENFDVSEVDISTIELTRADGEGGSVSPHEGPPGPHTVIGDAATPFDGELCDCHELTSDGFDDLKMKFKSQEVVAGLELEGEAPGAFIELCVSGNLIDGTPFGPACDCIRLVPPGTPPAMLAVHSNVTGAWFDLSPIDNQLDGGGFATFVRTFPLSSVVTLTAPKTQNGWSFEGWKLTSIAFQGLPDDPPGGLIPGRNLVLTIDSLLHTVEAIYAPPDWELAPDLGGGSNVGTASEPGAEAPEREAPSGKGS